MWNGWSAWLRVANISRGASADVALVQAAIEVYCADLAVEQAQFYASAVRGRRMCGVRQAGP